MDTTSLFKIGYGLYVVTTFDGKTHNGMINNTVTQISSTPTLISVAVNKQNYTYETIKKTGILNVNILTESAPFSIFQKYGFCSGRTVNKFENEVINTTSNGLAYLANNVNAVLSLKVKEIYDTESHGVFICELTDALKLNDDETMTYSYYQKNVKPKPQKKKVAGYSCKICGYFYQGDPLPEDFICPWCKHPASDFEKVEE